MGFEDIWNEGLRVLFALDVSAQVILAIGGIVVCLYLIKRLTTPSERR